MKKKLLLVVIFGILIIFNINLNNVVAVSFDVNNILSKANGFFGEAIKGNDSPFMDLTSLTDGIAGVIFTIGNVVILSAIVLMGLRYVWSRS